MRRKWTSCALLFAASCTLGVSFSLINPSHIEPDSSTYLSPAGNLLAGHGFTNDAGLAETNRTPGYPLFLATVFALGGGIRAVAVIQQILNALVVCGVWLLARSVTGSELAGWVSAFFFLADLTPIHQSNKILSDSLFAAVLFAAVCVCWKALCTENWHTAAMSGLLAGVATIVRPLSLFVPAAILPAIFLVAPRSRTKIAVVWTAAFLIIPLAWMGRNKIEQDTFVFSSIAGESILYYRAAGAMAGDEPGPMQDNFWKWHGRFKRDADAMVRERFGVDTALLSPSQKREQYTRLGAALIREHWFGYLRYSTYAAGMIVLDVQPPSMAEYERLNLPWKPPAAMVQWSLVALSRLSTVLSIAGLVVLWHRDRRLALLVVFVVAYLLAVSAGPEAYRRFRVPMSPWLASSAGCAVWWVVSSIRTRTEHPL